MVGSTVKPEDKIRLEEAVFRLTFPALLRVRNAVLAAVNRRDDVHMRAFEDALSNELGRTGNGLTIGHYQLLRERIAGCQDQVARAVLNRVDRTRRRAWSKISSDDCRAFFVEFWEALKSEREFAVPLEGYDYGGVSRRLAAMSGLLEHLLAGLVYFGCRHQNVYEEVYRLILGAKRQEQDRLAKDLPRGLQGDLREAAQALADDVNAGSKQRDILIALIRQLEMYPQKAAPPMAVAA
ncbi:hypothetical protein PLESTM_000148400 [Pleodorina starrii]|nr:hypothetical protein PLESTM_000148400 [Pleodorina starrii]